MIKLDNISATTAREAARDILYCDEDDCGYREVWAPFEHLDEDTLQEIEDNLTEAFINYHLSML